MDGNNGNMRQHATFVSDPRGSGNPSPPEVFCHVPLKSPSRTCGFPPYLPPLDLRRRVLSDTGDSLGPLAPPLTPLTAGCVRTPPWDPWDPPRPRFSLARDPPGLSDSWLPILLTAPLRTKGVEGW